MLSAHEGHRSVSDCDDRMKTSIAKSLDLDVSFFSLMSDLVQALYGLLVVTCIIYVYYSLYISTCHVDNVSHIYCVTFAWEVIDKLVISFLTVYTLMMASFVLRLDPFKFKI